MKTIFITGASSGIGRATAFLFHEKGWNVIASMRKPENEHELTKLGGVLVTYCDVTKEYSIKEAIAEGISAFGRIDALVNNAGYYSIGPFEASTSTEVQRQIQTNLIGTINTTKEILPFFREQRYGVIINISSIAGIISVPLQSLYHASKWGVEGFSESLQYELHPFNIHVKLIEPGVIQTDFYGRSMTVNQNQGLKDYAHYEKKVVGNLTENGKQGSSPKETAQTIYRAATDNRKKLRYPTGKSKGTIYFRRLLPEKVYRFFTKKMMEK